MSEENKVTNVLFPPERGKWDYLADIPVEDVARYLREERHFDVDRVTYYQDKTFLFCSVFADGKWERVAVRRFPGTYAMSLREPDVNILESRLRSLEKE